MINTYKTAKSNQCNYIEGLYFINKNKSNFKNSFNQALQNQTFLTRVSVIKPKALTKNVKRNTETAEFILTTHGFVLLWELEKKFQQWVGMKTFTANTQQLPHYVRSASSGPSSLYLYFSRSLENFSIEHQENIW